MRGYAKVDQTIVSPFPENVEPIFILDLENIHGAPSYDSPLRSAPNTVFDTEIVTNKFGSNDWITKVRDQREI